MKVLLFFGGPSEERDVSAGSIKPWVTYLQADPDSEVTVVFVDRDLQAYLLPPVYYYANTCADFESQLRHGDEALTWDEVADLARAHDVAVPMVHGAFGEVVTWFWRKSVEAAAIGPHTRAGRRFGSFGTGSIICFPPNTIFNEQFIRSATPLNMAAAEAWQKGRICLIGASTDRDARHRSESKYPPSMGYRIHRVHRFRRAGA